MICDLVYGPFYCHFGAYKNHPKTIWISHKQQKLSNWVLDFPPCLFFTDHQKNEEQVKLLFLSLHFMLLETFVAEIHWCTGGKRELRGKDFCVWNSGIFSKGAYFNYNKFWTRILQKKKMSKNFFLPNKTHSEYFTVRTFSVMHIYVNRYKSLQF